MTAETPGREEMLALAERLRRICAPNPQIKDDVIRVEALGPALNEASEMLERLAAKPADEVRKSISDFSDADLRNELHRRAQDFLGDPTKGVTKGMSEQPPAIAVETAFGAVKVKFCGVVHIHFRIDRYIGFHTWRMNENHFFIEIKLVGGKILAEYDTFEKWAAIIAGLDEAVAQ